MFLFLVLLNAIVIGGFCSYIAGQKNRSGFNWFVLGALFSLLALFALIAVPKLDETDSLRELGSIGAEVSLNSKASNDLFQDEPDLASDKYQLYLTKKFDIQKNATLEKYVVLDKLFQTLKEALEYAHGLSQKLVESARLEKLRSAYLIMKVNEYGKAKAAGVLVGDFLVSYNGCSISMDQ
jgi:flagellar motility protein MotE (MotC chaperone)